MKRLKSRHCTEEELLLHFLHEETPEVEREVADHLRQCNECDAVFKEYVQVVREIQTWSVEEPAEDAWAACEASLLAQYRRDLAGGKGKGFLPSLQKSLLAAWNYALENPLPTLGYIAVAVAFAMERTISTFRLDRILPGASEVFNILRQVF